VSRVLLPLFALAAAALAWPAPAAAHGLVQRANLPIPEWLFGWAAGVVLVVSFVALAVAWPQPRLERPAWRPLPWGLGRLLGSRVVEVVGGAVGVALLAVVVVAGFAGPQDPAANLAPTFLLITFWVGMAFASALLGDLFRLLNPWRAIGRAAGALLRRARGGRPVPVRPYPERLGHWPAALGLLAFSWVELASEWAERPNTLVTAALVYSAVTLVAQAVVGVEAWTRHGEGFSVYFGFLARLSPFETREGEVGLRPPLGGLARLEPLPGTVALVAVMIGTVTFDGLAQGPLWRDLAGADAGALADTVGILACVLAAGGLYALGVAGIRSVAAGASGEHLRRAFVHSLVPIALVYVAAHYLTFLLFEGQAIGYLASDPFGRGWDLLGTAAAGIDFGVISQNQAWYAQVGLVIAGHVAALVLAHDRALVLFGGSRAAVRSQYWMLGIMVGFTTLALWLLAQAGA
jgi:hypothetical protein